MICENYIILKLVVKQIIENNNGVKEKMNMKTYFNVGKILSKSIHLR